MAPIFVELVMEFKLEALSCLCLFLVPVLLRFLLTRQGEGKLAPGPTRLPFIGNLHQLGKTPHRSFMQLSHKHGPLMYLQLGHMPTVVVSSAELARECLKTQDLAFCSRPTSIGIERLSYGYLDIAFAPYSDHWRHVRKIGNLELFSTKKVEMQRPVREGEVGILVRTIRGLSSSGPINLSEMVYCYFNNISCRNIFGMRSSKEGECGKSRFEELIEETIAMMGAPWIGDYFPSLHWLDNFTGLRKRLDKTFHDMDQFLEKEIESQSHAADNTSAINSLLQLLKDPTLGMPFSKEHIKSILIDMFLGATETGLVTVEWGMTELMRNPRVMRKAQDELLVLVRGRDVVEESDLRHLKYLKQVVKEALRLHPPVPLLIRETREECTLGGFIIPAKTRVVINGWAIGRDPSCWKDPEAFWPERFEDSPIDYKGQNFELLPFGAGRRICPGMVSGSTAVELAIANLLHCFNWDLPEGMTTDDIDMTETGGLGARKTSNLILRATPIH